MPPNSLCQISINIIYFSNVVGCHKSILGMQNQRLLLMIDVWSKVIWHKNALPPQMDGSIVFPRWRQYAFPCRHIGATWWTRLNLCFLWTTQVHNPNGKSIGFGRSCTAHGRKSLYLHWAILSRKLPFRWIWIAIEYMLPWGHQSPQPKRYLDRFSRFYRAL